MLFSFIFLDYLITVIFCKYPSAEGNVFARSFMQKYGIVLGLTIFDLLMAIPLYAILCVDSHLVKFPGRLSTIIELLTDIGLGWLVAGAHFSGAASWLWDSSSMISQTIGLVIYEVATVPSLVNSRKLFLSLKSFRA